MRRILFAAPLILSACAGALAPNAPSLLPRAIETRSDAEPVIPPATVVADPAFDKRITERVVVFDLAATDFNTMQSGIAIRVRRARGATAGSDRWIDGQAAIGELQQLRTAADGAMADLEALAIERASAGAPPYPALEAATAKAQTELNRQAAIETRLKALIGA